MRMNRLRLGDYYLTLDLTCLLMGDPFAALKKKGSACSFLALLALDKPRASADHSCTRTKRRPGRVVEDHQPGEVERGGIKKFIGRKALRSRPPP